jgi:hypothetical protein
MNKLQEIIIAWNLSIRPTEPQIDLAKERFSICENCENKKDVIGKFPVCGLCYCPLNKKTFSPKLNSCEIGMWNNVDEKYKTILKK